MVGITVKGGEDLRHWCHRATGNQSQVNRRGMKFPQHFFDGDADHHARVRVPAQDVGHPAWHGRDHNLIPGLDPCINDANALRSRHASPPTSNRPRRGTLAPPMIPAPISRCSASPEPKMPIRINDRRIIRANSNSSVNPMPPQTCMQPRVAVSTAVAASTYATDVAMLLLSSQVTSSAARAAAIATYTSASRCCTD